MKRIASAAFVFAITLLSASCEHQNSNRADTIDAAEAASRIGRMVTIADSASVDRVRRAPFIVIDIGGFGVGSPLSAIIAPEDAGKFDVRSFDGKPVLLTGRVELSEGRPQIALKSADQLTIGTNSPALEACHQAGFRLAVIASTRIRATPPPHPFHGTGRTAVGVTLADDGSVAEDAVKESSGDADYDMAALDVVKSQWRWEPLIPQCRGGFMKTLVFFSWQ